MLKACLMTCKGASIVMFYHKKLQSWNFTCSINSCYNGKLCLMPDIYKNISYTIMYDQSCFETAYRGPRSAYEYTQDLDKEGHAILI